MPIKRIRIATLLVTALATAELRAAPQEGQAPPPPPPDIVGFCQSQDTVDFPDAAFSPADYEAGRLPEQIAAVEGASKWRCMDRRVLLCQDSADGDWCSIKDPSLQPNTALKQECADHPGQDAIATAMTSYSSSQWRCHGRMAVASNTLLLDARGFFKVTWVAYTLRPDGTPAPVAFPDGVR